MDEYYISTSDFGNESQKAVSECHLEQLEFSMTAAVATHKAEFELKESYDEMKEMIKNEASLHLNEYEATQDKSRRPLEWFVDACDYGKGCTLAQMMMISLHETWVLAKSAKTHKTTNHTAPTFYARFGLTRLL